MGILDKIFKKRRENNTPIGGRIVPGNDEQRELYNRSRGKMMNELKANVDKPLGRIVPGNDEQRELYNRSRGKKHKEPEEEYK